MGHVAACWAPRQNEPNRINLGYLAKALGVEPENLLPPTSKSPTAPTAQAITSLDGRTRLIIDAEVATSVAMEVMALVRAGIVKDRDD